MVRGLCERSQVAPAAAGNNLQKPVGAPPSGCIGDDNLRFVSALAYWHGSVMELMLQMRNTFMFVCGVCVCVCSQVFYIQYWTKSLQEVGGGTGNSFQRNGGVPGRWRTAAAEGS